MVTLQNVSRRMQVYQLDHGAFQEHASKAHAYKLIHTTVVEHARNGALSARRKPRLVPQSLSFATGEMVHSLPNEVLQCADIKRALAARELRIIAQDDSPVPAPEAPAAKAEEKKNSNAEEKKNSNAPTGDAPKVK